ncbi:excalibur calcium-binding domain-containing protein [Pseudaminobacter sp. NGMCC 1.201702]|uniref:excalibur calcium-binding domain-containing protein n=1 Tax=Pseudaminobacter sp. NGMCC 1.201702 TaxID=3391825 RepID=UPI0039EF913B
MLKRKIDYQANLRGARRYSFQDDYHLKKAQRTRIDDRLWWLVIALAILALSGVIAWHPLRSIEVNSVWDAVGHLAAAPNCNAARAVGLAPARRGQPGYWLSHDRDRDGWACEPWPR